MSEPDLVAGLLPGRSRLSGWTLVERQMETQIQAGVTTEERYREHLESAGLMPSWERYNAFKTAHPDEEVPPEINRVQSTRDMRAATWEAEQIAERKDLA